MTDAQKSKYETRRKADLIHRLRTKAPYPLEGNRIVTDLLGEAADSLAERDAVIEGLSKQADLDALEISRLILALNETSAALSRAKGEG